MKTVLRISLLLIPILFCMNRRLSAAEIDVRFESANQAYRSGDYSKAAKLYEEILSQGYESEALHYNLGNCNYKLNHVPAAILEFERARKLDPDDEDIRHNLTLANLRVIDRVEPIPDLFYVDWWRKCADLASADRWGSLAVGSLWLAVVLCAALLLPYRSFLVRRIISFVALAGFVLFLVSLAAALDRRSREQNHSYGIVFAASTSARSAPDEQSTSLFVLHEGVKVELLDRVGDWNKIRLADGKIGWIQSSTFQII